MTPLFDLHVHTRYCDGKNSPEEIIEYAIEKGLSAIGFSGHSYTPFDKDYCMAPDVQDLYFQELSLLKKKYAPHIRVLAGIEQDYFSGPAPDMADFVIGSVHYILKDGEFVSVDADADRLKDAVDSLWNGDSYSALKDYFDLVSKVCSVTGAKIVGHFDLITKFNPKLSLFNTDSPEYTRYAFDAADSLVREGAVFELNTGAVSRGYKDTPYPSMNIIDHIISADGKFILSSDSHKKENLCSLFDIYSKNIPCDSFASLDSVIK